jgi:pantetheine-phosphate adenylyltransferase
VTTVLYPGSFDPIHNGHLEIVEVASRLFDDVVVATVRNPQKGQPLFTLDERKAMIADSVAHLDNVRITVFASLVVDLAKEVGADFIVKGLRVVSDFESELMQAQMNRAVSGIDTMFIPATSNHSFVASKFIREIARYGGDITSMVPSAVAKCFAEKQQEWSSGRA